MARRRSGYIVAKGGKKTLPSFNINVGKHRTSVRLSRVVAEAVETIATHERCDLSRSTAIRGFALRYFIEAETATGTRKAGHGKLLPN